MKRNSKSRKTPAYEGSAGIISESEATSEKFERYVESFSRVRKPEDAEASERYIQLCIGLQYLLFGYYVIIVYRSCTENHIKGELLFQD